MVNKAQSLTHRFSFYVSYVRRSECARLAQKHRCKTKGKQRSTVRTPTRSDPVTSPVDQSCYSCTTLLVRTHRTVRHRANFIQSSPASPDQTGLGRHLSRSLSAEIGYFIFRFMTVCACLSQAHRRFTARDFGER